MEFLKSHLFKDFIKKLSLLHFTPQLIYICTFITYLKFHSLLRLN